MNDIEETSRNHLPYVHSTNDSDKNSTWKCRHKSGPDVRNLVVCIDGTANQFGQKNTNVIELYHLIRKEVGSNQLTWYNSGIGTYARPSWKSLKYYRQVIDHKIDLAIAWNFERTILAAYRWLSDNYQEGDRIFLFGFSRGAFQVRVLSAMIQKVGLIHKGNEEQIPFAYELYADPQSGETRDAGDGTTSESMAGRFKKTFSHAKADVHYVGVWDTVSSIGIARGKYMLPGTVDGMKHVCYFRHALALDERRVKFAPEYAYGGSATAPPPESNRIPANEIAQPTQTQQSSKNGQPPQTLEVWFAGTHSDIGGGNVVNEAMNRNRPPLRWMVFESVAAGLRTEPFHRFLSSNEQIEVKESLSVVWWILELLPLGRLTYTGQREGNKTTHKPHLGKPRKIQYGQKIHGSLLLTNKKEYTPRALPSGESPFFWTMCRLKGLGDWKADDLFEGTQDLATRFLEQRDEKVWELFRRTVTTLDGQQAVYEGTLGALQALIGTDLSTKVELIRNILIIFDETRNKGTALKTFDLEKVEAVFRGFLTSDNESDADIARTFLRRFTTFKPRLEVTGHMPNSAIPTVAITANGTRIISGLLDYSIRIWDTKTQTPIGEPFRGHTNIINAVVVSPDSDGRFIVSGSKDGTIRLWNMQTGMSTLLAGHTDSVRSLAISPNGKWVASGSEDATVRIWDVDRRIPAGEPLVGHGNIVHAVGFSRDGRQVVSCSIDKRVCVWDVQTHQPADHPLIIGSDEDWLLASALSSDGKRLAAGFSDGSIRVWDLEERGIVGNSFWVQEGVICSLAFSPDGKNVASGSDDGKVSVWNCATQQRENTFQHQNWVRCLAFFSEGKGVVTGCDDGMIRIWDTEPIISRH